MKKIMKVLLFMVLFIRCINSSTVNEEICENTLSSEVLQGKHMISRSGRDFCAFLGIPYAAPPIGKLRFFPPVPFPDWNKIKNFTREGNICLQRELGGSEDCLYLNIFTHSTRNATLVPVMVYIHGGGFFMGSSSMDSLGPEYFMDKDIVLVILQYRLGVFGFLSTEDDIIPGNMGLKDQVRALQWVQENIIYFGGDHRKVTIFGVSAGGASVHFHMQSPLSRDLFVRGISQSGTAFSGFALATKGICKNITKHIALNLNCSVTNSTDILKCLQNKSSIDIFNAYSEQVDSRYDFNKILLRPVIEEESQQGFLTYHPTKITTEKPWIVGVTANEGIFKITTKRLNETLNLIKTSFQNFMPKILFYDNCNNKTEISNKIYEFYIKSAISTNDKIKSLEQVITDSWFVWPTEQSIRNHNGSLYFYLYNHSSEHSFTELYGCPQGFGVSHTDDLRVLFTQKSFFPELNKYDTNISKLMVDFWVNFATEGTPTPNPISRSPQQEEAENFIWKSSNNTKPIYLHIQTDKLTMDEHLFSKRLDFWRGSELGCGP